MPSGHKRKIKTTAVPAPAFDADDNYPDDSYQELGSEGEADCGITGDGDHLEYTCSSCPQSKPMKLLSFVSHIQFHYGTIN